jgi:outer membrane receptor protein involved in Fe transport
LKGLGHSPACDSPEELGLPAAFDPEFSDSYEIGLKTQWLNRTLMANLAIFYTEYEDFQLNTFNGLNFAVSNAGSVESKGAELETRWAPVENFSANLGVAYVDAKYGDDPELALDPDGAGALPALSGQQLTNAPEWTVTGGLNYDHELVGEITGFANVGGIYRSSYNTGSNLHPRKEQDAFTTFNARLGIRNDEAGWEAYVWGQNITDEGYYNIVFDSVFQSGSFSASLGEPATYGVTVRKDF